MMAEKYQKRPSEILDIDDGYVAYCIDEMVVYLTTEVTDKKGNRNWNKLRWQDDDVKGNKEFMNFISRGG